MLNIYFAIALFGSTLAMRDQSYAVKAYFGLKPGTEPLFPPNPKHCILGKLMCGVQPAKNVRIKLWEEDTGPDPDDLLDSGYTDDNGEFRLTGGTAELTPIDPIFKVYHDCDDGIKPGKRKVRFLLPKSYITNGKVSKKDFDIGVLNLETIFPKEEREMIVTRRRRELEEGSVYDDNRKHKLHHQRQRREKTYVLKSDDEDDERYVRDAAEEWREIYHE